VGLGLGGGVLGTSAGVGVWDGVAVGLENRPTCAAHLDIGRHHELIFLGAIGRAALRAVLGAAARLVNEHPGARPKEVAYSLVGCGPPALET